MLDVYSNSIQTRFLPSEWLYIFGAIKLKNIAGVWHGVRQTRWAERDIV